MSDKLYEVWQCPYPHDFEISCRGCGWTLLDGTVWVDEHWRVMELNKQVNETRINTPEGPVRLKVSVFWLKGGNIHDED